MFGAERVYNHPERAGLFRRPARVNLVRDPVAFTDSGASALGGIAQVGGQFVCSLASSVQVLLHPSAEA